MNQYYKSVLWGVYVFSMVLSMTLLQSKIGNSQAPDWMDKFGFWVEQETVTGYIGGEKEELFKDHQLQKIFKEKYHVTVKTSKKGSLEMFQTKDQLKQDFLFPAGQLGYELEKEKYNFLADAALFRSPLVFYTWSPVKDALLKKGLLKQRDGAYYLTDLKLFFQMIQERKKWTDIEPSLPNKEIIIDSTNPKYSNSGTMFFALLSYSLSEQGTISEENYKQVTTFLRDYYKRIGFQEDSSKEIFDDYIQKGIGDKTMIVGYENQIIQYAKQHPDSWKKGQKDQLVVIYPPLTIWSDHTLLVRNDKASVLIDALREPEIQQLIWEKYGFRTRNVDQKDVQRLGIPGIAVRIDSVNMIKGNVMKKILQGL